MSAPDIIWSGGRGQGRRLRYVFDLLAGLKGSSPRALDEFTLAEFMDLKRYKKTEALVILPKASAFYDQFDCRTSGPADQERILANELSKLHPIEMSEAVTLINRAHGEPGNLDLLIIRKETMARLEAHAGSIGVRHLELASSEAPGIQLPSPVTAGQSMREARVWMLAALAGFLALWAFSGAAALRSERELAVLELERVRLAALISKRQEEEARVSSLELFAETSPETKTVPARLEQWARWNASTPDEAFWEEVRMDGTITFIKGSSANAASTLLSFVQALPESRVSFSEAISDDANGRQNFVIQIAPKPEGDGQ